MPEELSDITGGIWLKPPAEDWNPQGTRALLGRLRYASDHINIVKNAAQLATAREHLTDCSEDEAGEGGALALPTALFSESDLSWNRLPVLLLPPQAKPLEALAKAGRARFTGRVVVVVGSVGKTTTRLIISKVLGSRSRVVTNRGNWNYRGNLFEQLSSIDPNTDYFVAELGLGQKGADIAGTVEVLAPHAVVFTQLGLSHIDVIEGGEALDSEELLSRILKRKSEAFSGLKRFGVAVVNADMPLADKAVELARKYTPTVVTYGESADADCRLLSYDDTPEGCEITFRSGEQVERVPLHLRGRPLSVNALAAWTVATFFGFEAEAVLPAMSSFEGKNGRSRLLKLELQGKPVWVFDDSFNATPFSMQTCFTTLSGTARVVGAERKIAVLGDILHLGPESDRLHAGLADHLVGNGIDLVFTLGENMAHLSNALPENMRGAHCSTNDELVEQVLAALRGGDIIAVKASTPLRFVKVVDALRNELAPPVAEVSAETPSASISSLS